MNNLRFGCDLDGVICNFGAQVISVANSLWPGKLAEDYVPQDWGYTGIFSKDDWNAVWAEIKQTPNFWLDASAYRENVEVLKDFLDDTLAEVYFITSRTETVGDSVLIQSSQWLRNRALWPRNGHSTLIPVSDPQHKAAMLQGLNLPFMLDDYAVTVQSLQVLQDTKTFLLDQPWNRAAVHLPRLYSVAEYLEIVKESIDEDY